MQHLLGEMENLWVCLNDVTVIITIIIIIHTESKSADNQFVSKWSFVFVMPVMRAAVEQWLAH